MIPTLFQQCCNPTDLCKQRDFGQLFACLFVWPFIMQPVGGGNESQHGLHEHCAAFFSRVVRVLTTCGCLSQCIAAFDLEAPYQNCLRAQRAAKRPFGPPYLPRRGAFLELYVSAPTLHFFRKVKRRLAYRLAFVTIAGCSHGLLSGFCRL